MTGLKSTMRAVSRARVEMPMPFFLFSLAFSAVVGALCATAAFMALAMVAKALGY